MNCNKCERLSPKQPVLLKTQNYSTVYQCPSCGNFVRKTGNYCDKCGQAFDWGFGELLEKHKDDDLFCKIMKYRFVDGLTIPNVAKKVFVSERQVYRIMNKYLEGSKKNELL
jgi:predicted amidophosphoribosyltransferase